MNVEQDSIWSLRPGSEHDALGTALRNAIGQQASKGQPRDLIALLADLNQSNTKGGLSVPRELIDTGKDKRFVRRDREGRFSESDDVGRGLAQDQRGESNRKPKKGEGDKGDR